jgi:hypothetical protein
LRRPRAGLDLERELGPLLEAEKRRLLVWSPLAGGVGQVQPRKPVAGRCWSAPSGLASSRTISAAVDITLSDEGIRQLDAVSELPPEYSGWILATQGADRLGPGDLWIGKVSSAS